MTRPTPAARGRRRPGRRRRDGTARLRETRDFAGLPVARWVGVVGTVYCALVSAAALAQDFTPWRVAAAVLVVAPQVVLTTAGPVPAWPASLVSALGAILLVGGNSASAGLLALYYVPGMAAYLCRLLPGAAILVVCVSDMVGHAIADLLHHRPTGWYLSAIGLVVSWAVGALARRQQLTLAALRRAQTELSEQAASAERERIARDVHDLVAHSLSVTMLHLTAARLALDHDLGAARRSLQDAERLGRESMTEIRRTVGLLPRSPDEAGEPVPGADQVTRLVDGYRRAGMPVALDVGGSLEAVPASVGLSLYRILQESLANAARHAPAQETCVSIRVEAGAVDLRVENDLGPRRPDERDTHGGQGGGHGLAGMAERARLAGGRLSAAAVGDRWVVSARLPVEEDGA